MRECANPSGRAERLGAHSQPSASPAAVDAFQLDATFIGVDVSERVWSRHDCKWASCRTAGLGWGNCESCPSASGKPPQSSSCLQMVVSRRLDDCHSLELTCELQVVSVELALWCDDDSGYI